MKGSFDLVCLVADKSMQATLEALLERPQSLSIRSIQFRVLVHPEHDPGCFHTPEALLKGFANDAAHALVMLDRAWQGVPKGWSADQIEGDIERRLSQTVKPDWARAVVIAPELEAWVFTPSPHVAETLGWTQGDTAHLREALINAGLWHVGEPKPRDPKRAMDWVLQSTGVARSSSLFRQLAEKVSLRRCQDRAFRRLVGILHGWFS